MSDNITVEAMNEGSPFGYSGSLITDNETGRKWWVCGQHYMENPRIEQQPDGGWWLFASPTQVFLLPSQYSVGQLRCDWMDAITTCEACGGLVDDYMDVRVNRHDWEVWCVGCVESSTAYCHECDSYYSDSCDACPERDCRVSNDERFIYNYGYKPTPIFMRSPSEFAGGDTSKLFAGIELEVEVSEDSDRTEVAQMVHPETDPFFYMKEDGSLDYGIEFVSHPATLAAWRELDWGWLEKLRRDGTRAWDRSTCGLHIHLSTDGFDSRAHFARWHMFMHANAEQWIRLAGRSSSYASWEIDQGSGPARAAAIWRFPEPRMGSEPTINANGSSAEYRESCDRWNEWDRKRRKFQSPIAGKAEVNYQRYVALNVQGRKTVELRFWRPSLRWQTVMGAIEASFASVDYARTLSVKPSAKGESFDWLRFVEFCNDRDYPMAALRIGERFRVRPRNDSGN